MSMKKPSHRRTDSEELDVFEAARYFSGYNDNYTLNMTQKVAHHKEEKRGYMREGRVSLDVPSLKHYYLHQNKQHPLAQTQQHLQQLQQQQQQQKTNKEKKKHKQQPSSPGGKIAQFLNSLFNQTSSKKKKSLKSLSTTTTTTTQSMKEYDDESPSIGRRKRRSSISHFRSTSSAIDSRSIYSISDSGFQTPPPPYNLTSNTPSSKSCKDFKGFSDYKDVLATLSKYSIHEKNNATSKDDHKIITSRVSSNSNNNNFDWIDEKLRLVEKSSKNNYNNNNHHHGFHQEKIKKKNEIIKKLHDDHDDGGDSDSSSDLFELQIDYDFGFCSSGLPVYETTHLDNIKRPSSTAINNGLIKA